MIRELICTPSLIIACCLSPGKLLHEKKEHTIAKYLNDQITAEFQAVQRTLDVNAEDTAMALHQVIHLMNDELKEQDHSGTDLESRYGISFPCVCAHDMYAKLLLAFPIFLSAGGR